jgi:hypothetical protein
MRSIRAVLVLMALGLPMHAMAQPAGPAVGQPFRKWDVGGGVGIRFGETEDTVVPAGAWIAEAGRYWTPHIKTSIAVMTAGQTTYNSSSYDPRALRSGYTETATRPAGYAASLAYQFFDNEFVHPFVSAGARFASSVTTTKVYSTRSPYQTLSTDSTDRLELRPTIGGGFKSYFGDGRAFMRTELLMAVGPHGSPHAILQIGAGVDF